MSNYTCAFCIIEDVFTLLVNDVVDITYVVINVNFAKMCPYFVAKSSLFSYLYIV